MSAYTKENIFKLMERYVNCPSVSGTSGEADMAKVIYESLADADYFRNNKELLAAHPYEGDPLSRSLVTALVIGRSRRTVIVTGHFDTVGFESYGVYKDLATKPSELTKALNPAHLSRDAGLDLQSGDWIFGRGVADMKYGLALGAALTMELSCQADSLPASLLFLAVGDEENNSAGMSNALRVLEDLRLVHGLDYAGLINNEPHLTKDGRHELDLGTVGKVMPAFFCAGKEGHASLMFDALSGSAMLAELMRELEFSFALTDELDGVCTLPATALKIGDNKESYSVSMPHIAWAYYTVSTVSMTPDNILERCRQAAARAFDSLLKKISGFTAEYNRLTGSSFECGWKNRVVSYEELLQDNRRLLGDDFDKMIEDFADGFKLSHPDADERELTIAIVNEVIRLSPDTEPCIVIAFMPPYYPHSVNKELSEKERFVMDCARAVAEYSADNFSEEWFLQKICLQLSDMAYCNADFDERALSALKPNMPLLGRYYHLPLDCLSKFKVPAMNLGYASKDIHQTWERLYLPFAQDVLPDLLSFAIRYMMEGKQPERSLS